MRRRGLLAFGAALAGLFAVVGASEGIGHAGLPPNAVAIVEDVSGSAGTITASRFWRGVEQYAALDGKSNPHEGPFAYYETRALEILLERAWIRGNAQQLGISVKPALIARKIDRLKAKSLHNSEAAYRRYLREAKYTQADVDEIVESQLLAEAIGKRTVEKPPRPNEQAIKEYYEAARPTRFIQKNSRDVRVIVSNKAKEALAAKRELERDNSPAGWAKVAKRYSIDPAGKTTGGLNRGLVKGTAEEPLNRDLFSAPMDRVEGPVDGGGGRIYVFEALRETPGRVRPLSEVRAEVVSQLEQHAAEEAFARHTADYHNTWASRTVCAPWLAIKDCADFVNGVHPTNAPAACYEPSPKGGRPEACPAPVAQRLPAIPGSVNPAEPGGKPLPQEPRPADSH